MSQPQEQTVDLNAILKEVGGEIDQLIKSEQARLDAAKAEEATKLAKKEESSMKKEESSSKEMSMKKDEGSGFESPAPEASSPSPEASASSAAPGAEGQGEDLQSMVQSLDDDMLHELMQTVQMEMEARSKSASPAPAAGASPAPASSASASPAAPAMKREESSMMYKKELEAMQEKLAKSEEQSKNLEKAVSTMTELMEKMVNRPVTKAVTDIRNVEFVDKGEKELKKTEQADVSDEEFYKKAKKIAGSQQELGKLTKNEREALSAYFVTKRRSPEVLKLISK